MNMHLVLHAQRWHAGVPALVRRMHKRIVMRRANDEAEAQEEAEAYLARFDALTAVDAERKVIMRPHIEGRLVTVAQADRRVAQLTNLAVNAFYVLGFLAFVTIVYGALARGSTGHHQSALGVGLATIIIVAIASMFGLGPTVVLGRRIPASLPFVSALRTHPAWYLVLWLVVVSPTVVVLGRISHSMSGETLSSLLTLVGVTLMLLLEVALVVATYAGTVASSTQRLLERWRDSRYMDAVLLRAYLILLSAIEQAPQAGSVFSDEKAMIRRLEEAAVCLERGFGRRFRGIDLEAEVEMLHAGRRMAAAVRSLKAWVYSARGTTRADLESRLAEDLWHVSCGLWGELDQADPDNTRVLLMRWLIQFARPFVACLVTIAAVAGLQHSQWAYLMPNGAGMTGGLVAYVLVSVMGTLDPASPARLAAGMTANQLLHLQGSSNESPQPHP